MTEYKPYTFDRVIRLIITLALIVGVIYILRVLSDVLLPFVVALLLAYLVNPIVNRWQKLVKRRGLAILITMILLLAVFTALWYLLIPSIGNEINRMGELISAYSQNWHKPGFVPDDLQAWIKELAEMEEVQQYLTAENSFKLLQNLLPGIWSSFKGVFAFLLGVFGLVTVLLYFFFILIDFDEFSGKWKDYVPPRFREQVVGVVSDLEKGMTAYFRNQTKIVIIVAILFATGFKIIGLPMGITLGIVTGLLNYVPYLQWAALLPTTIGAAIISLETGNNFWFMLAMVLLVFAIVQLIQEVILTPKIMGDMTGMNPALMLLSLSIWGSLLGILGMVIALPVTTLMISYYRRFVLETSLDSSKKEEQT